MAKVGIEHNGVFIGAMNLPNRQKPGLVVERGNEVVILGAFTNMEMVEEFEKALKELLEVGEIDMRGEKNEK